MENKDVYESLDKTQLIAAPSNFSDLVSSPNFFSNFNSLTNTDASTSALPDITIVGTRDAGGVMRDAQGNPAFMSDLDITAKMGLESTLSAKNFGDATLAFDEFHDDTNIMQSPFSEDRLTDFELSQASNYILPADMKHGVNFLQENFTQLDSMDGAVDHITTRSGLESAASLEQQQISNKFSHLLDLNSERRRGTGSPLAPEAVTTFEFEHIDEIIKAEARYAQ